VNTEPLPGSLVNGHIAAHHARELAAYVKAEARQRARQTTDPSIKSAFENVTRGWLLLAEQVQWMESKKVSLPQPKNNGIAHAGDCNHSDRRACNRLRSPQVGGSPSPLTTTAATSVLIARG
jgi:hypothetical protein